MEDWLRFKCAGHDDEEGIRGEKKKKKMEDSKQHSPRKRGST